jgi:hypothetical protein
LPGGQTAKPPVDTRPTRAADARTGAGVVAGGGGIGHIQPVVIAAALYAWLGAAPAPALPAAVEPTEPPGRLAATAAPPRPVWGVPIAHAAGLLAGMRLTLSALWPGAYDPFPLGRSARRFEAAFGAPPERLGDRWLLESDGDPWTINVVAHGLFGAEVYGRVRQCGGGPWQALAFAAGTSVAWEYGVESFSKRPSAVDLVLTPLIGAALGEARFQAQRALRRAPRGFWRRAAEIVVDPLGEAERGVLGTRC